MRILYFDIDCLRPDHLGCYGYPRPTSPTIDAVARQAVRYDRYYCQSSPCLPSRTAMVSGRFGIRNGVLSNHGEGARFRLRTRNYVGPEADNEMFPRQLRRNGYDTFCFSNFADRHNALWFMYGWSEFHTPNLKGGAETADEVNAMLLPWLRANAAREDYYLHVNYWDAHRCYKMDARWADRFRGHPVPQAWPDEAAIRGHQSIRGPFTATGQFPDHRSPYPLMPGSVASRADFEHMITGYDASIAYVDDALRQVLEELDRQKLLDDTAIIISGDHGDAFGEHGIYSDHVCADECIHHVPLLIKWPGAQPAVVGDELLTNADFAPTICDLLSIPSPPEWDGASFAGTLRGGKGPGRDYLVWDHGLYTLQRAVRTHDHLLVRTIDDFGYRFDPIELYDMNADPWQARNIASQRPDLVAALTARMTDWVEAQVAKGPLADPLLAIWNERKAAKK